MNEPTNVKLTAPQGVESSALLDIRMRIYFRLRKFIPKMALIHMVIAYQRIHNKIKFGDWRFPHDIAIEIGTKCNRRCSYCPQSVLPDGNNRITEDNFIAILERIAELNWDGPVGYSHFNEPLLDKRIVWFVETTKRYLPKSMPTIYSNGDALSFELAEKLISAGVVKFVITRHDHDFVMWNAKILPMQKRWPSYFHLGDLHVGTVGRRGGYLTDDTLNFEVFKSCTLPEGSMHITMDGDMMQCCCDYTHGHLYGNVIREGIIPIWNKSEYVRLRDEVRAGKPRLDICKGCFGLQKNNLLKIPKQKTVCDIYTPTGMHWCSCHKAHKESECAHIGMSNDQAHPTAAKASVDGAENL